MPILLDVNGLKLRGAMPSQDIDALEAQRPGFTQTVLDDVASMILSRLRKRYDAKAIQANPPRVVLRWQAAITVLDLYRARGWNPGSAEDDDIIKNAERAEDQVKEAADSKDGLFDLPLLDAQDDSAVTKGGPLAYTETSPYAWTDLQRQTGRGEDGCR